MKPYLRDGACSSYPPARLVRSGRSGGPAVLPIPDPEAPTLHLIQPKRHPTADAALDSIVFGQRTRLLLIAARPAQALMHLGFGGGDAWPLPHEHARIWEHWARTSGGAPVLLGRSSIEGTLARPPETREALVRLAREVVQCNADAAREGLLVLAAILYRNAHLSLWWD